MYHTGLNPCPLVSLSSSFNFPHISKTRGDRVLPTGIKGPGSRQLAHEITQKSFFDDQAETGCPDLFRAGEGKRSKKDE